MMPRRLPLLWFLLAVSACQADKTTPVTSGTPASVVAMHAAHEAGSAPSASWYRPDTYAVRAMERAVAAHPQGPADSPDPQEPGAAKRVVRGGSFLSSDEHRSRYLVGSRGKAEVTSGASNLGLRLVRSAQ